MHRAGVGRGLRVVEGVWGHDREVLLRRTRVVLDVHRIPGNFVGLRLLLSLAAGAALVTEPMTDPYPFMPGRSLPGGDRQPTCWGWPTGSRPTSPNGGDWWRPGRHCCATS